MKGLKKHDPHSYSNSPVGSSSPINLGISASRQRVTSFQQVIKQHCDSILTPAPPRPIMSTPNQRSLPEEPVLWTISLKVPSLRFPTTYGGVEEKETPSHQNKTKAQRNLYKPFKTQEGRKDIPVTKRKLDIQVRAVSRSRHPMVSI